MLNKANRKKVALGDIASIYQPQTIAQNQFTENGFPVYGANGIIGFFNNFNHDKDQVLLSCRGENCGSVNFSVGKCWITGNTMVINVDQNKKIDKKYLYYQLKSQNLRYLISGSGQPQIVRNVLTNHEIQLVDLSEQEKIGSFLSAIDRFIEKQKEKVERIKSLKKGYLQKMFPADGKDKPEIRFKGFSGGWQEINLGKHGSFFKGNSYGRDNISESGENLILYGDLFTLYSGRIEKVINHTESVFDNTVYGEPGDLLFPGSTTVDALSLISPSALMKKSLLGGDVIAYRSKKLSAIFLAFLILGRYRQDFAKKAQGTTIVHMYASSLSEIPIMVPIDKQEQEQIGSFLSAIDRLIEKEESAIERYESLKKGYLQKIFAD